MGFEGALGGVEVCRVGIGELEGVEGDGDGDQRYYMFLLLLYVYQCLVK